MSKLIVSEFITLDGVFEDPGGSEGTKRGGWSMHYSNAEYQSYKSNELKAAEALLLGRITYDGFAAAWPKMKGTGEFGEKMNSMPKYVVTSKESNLSWKNSHAISGDILGQIKQLKSQAGKNILVAGSGQLVRFLLDNDLVDKLCLMVHPVILGSGKRLLNGAEYHKLKLTYSKTLDTGTVILEYAPEA